jgi:NDP-sugar pyrophosphorylase family protein
MGPKVAVIVAEGHGECLRRGDEYVPKLLLPIGARPLLEHHLAWLSGHGYREVTLCLSCKADQVRAHFGDGSRFGVKLRYSVDQKPQGDAGAVKALGAASLPEDILIFSGDLYPDFDLHKLLRAHAEHDALATVVVRAPAKGQETGLVALGPNRTILDFQHAPSTPRGTMATANMWLIRRSLLHFVPDERPSDFLLDVFPAALNAGKALIAYPEKGTLVDLGAPGAYDRFASRLLVKKGA